MVDKIKDVMKVMGLGVNLMDSQAQSWQSTQTALLFPTTQSLAL
jgi:hypothetical protein